MGDALAVPLVVLEAMAVAIDRAIGQFLPQTNADRLDARWRSFAELVTEMCSQPLRSDFSPREQREALARSAHLEGEGEFRRHVQPFAALLDLDARSLGRHE